MIQQFQKKSFNLSFLPYLVLFLVSVVYFHFYVDYIFFYQEKSSLFVLSSDYLNKFLHQPGSLLVYLGNFLTTFYYYSLSGSVIVSAIICLIVFFVSGILNFLTGKKAAFIPFLIGGVLFYLHSNYQYLIYNSLGILFQLVFFFLTIRYLRDNKSWLVIIITPLWYFATGSFALIFYLMLTFYSAFGAEKRAWIKILFLWGLNLLLLYFAKEFLLFQPINILLIYPFSIINIGLQSLLFISLIAVLSILPVLARINTRNFIKIRIPWFIPYLIVPLVIISGTLILNFQRIDENNKQYFHVEKLFYQNKPDEIIEYNLMNPSNNMLTSYLTNITLCETGKLNDLLFSFPQSLENNTLFLQWKRVSEVLKRGGYFYYTIGMINETHRWFYEYMVMDGMTPEGLKMLIKTEIINGNYAMASKYVSILEKSLFYKKEAGEFEKLLFNDEAVLSHPELGENRKTKLKSDFFVATQNPSLNLENVLASDSLNKNAFEYKLALLLLKKDFLNIVKELPKLETFGYKKIPVHIEEAVVVYKALTNGDYVYPGKLKISEKTELRFKQYYQTFQQFGNDRKAAQPALKIQFGDTFWYYVFYF